MNKMKRTIGVLMMMLLPVFGSAQGERSIEKGNLLINPAITLGWYDYGYALDAVNILPPVALNFEYATSDYFSFGLEAEYGLRRYKDLFFFYSSNEYKYEYKSIGVRGSFHYLDFLKSLLEDNLGGLNSSKLDLYVGASTGLLITTFNHTWNDGINATDHERKSFDSTWRFGYIAGARYYFSNNFGAFIEGGRNSLGWAKLGLTLKF